MSGTLVVIFLLCGICGKALLTGGLAGDYLGRYICVGVFAMMAFQVVVNIGMNIGLMPGGGHHPAFFLLRRQFPAVQLPGYGAGAQRVYGQQAQFVQQAVICSPAGALSLRCFSMAEKSPPFFPFAPGGFVIFHETVHIID